MLYNQTKLYQTIMNAIGKGEPKPYALLNLIGKTSSWNETLYHTVISYQDGPAFFRFLNESSDSIIEMNQVYLFDCSNDLQTIVIFEDESRRFFYGVPLFSGYVNQLRNLEKEGLYFQKFLCKFNPLKKAARAAERVINFHYVGEDFYCVIETYQDKQYPLGYISSQVLTRKLNAFCIKDSWGSSKDSNTYRLTDGTLSSILEDSLFDYLQVFGGDTHE